MKLYLVLLMLITPMCLLGQDSKNKPDSSATYEGGEAQMWKDITNELRYPIEAVESGVSGTIKVKITIDETGAISNMETVGKKRGGGLEEEAMRVVKSLKRWNPAMKDGKPVKDEKIIPVKFRMLK